MIKKTIFMRILAAATNIALLFNRCHKRRKLCWCLTLMKNSVLRIWHKIITSLPRRYECMWALDYTVMLLLNRSTGDSSSAVSFLGLEATPGYYSPDCCGTQKKKKQDSWTERHWPKSEQPCIVASWIHMFAYKHTRLQVNLYKRTDLLWDLAVLCRWINTSDFLP